MHWSGRWQAPGAVLPENIGDSHTGFGKNRTIGFSVLSLS